MNKTRKNAKLESRKYKQQWIGFIDLAYNPNTGIYVSPAHVDDDTRCVAVWGGEGYWDKENERYFQTN